MLIVFLFIRAFVSIKSVMLHVLRVRLGGTADGYGDLKTFEMIDFKLIYSFIHHQLRFLLFQKLAFFSLTKMGKRAYCFQSK